MTWADREHTAELQAEIDRLRVGRAADTDEIAAFQTEVEQLGATIERVRALHIVNDNGFSAPWCRSDKMLWPCPTIRALEGPPHG